MGLPVFLERYRDEIDAELRSSINGNSLPLYTMMRYHLGWTDAKGNPATKRGGKAVRPALCLLSCEAAGGERRTALPAAAAIELLHNYSLIHDDVQDDDRERRHLPTVWAIWGKPQAINAGTAMRMLASLELRRLAGPGVPAEKVLRTQELLDETTLRLLEGQYLDISFEGRLDITLADYFEMIAGKTAALIACSTEAGALLATDDAATIAGMRDAGRDLGMAFQIRDDILGIWGNEAETGKPQGSDLRRRKKSMPVVFALMNAKGAAKERLLEVYRKQSPDDRDVQDVLDVLDKAGAKRVAQETTQNFCNEARKRISSLKLNTKVKPDFEELAHFLAERNA